MPSLEIITKGDKNLEKKSVEIKKNKILEYKKFAKDLEETMLKNTGIGIAAPQVGKNIRMICLHQEATGEKEHLILINPKITYKSKQTIELEEGCISIPGVLGLVERAEKVRVKYLDLTGQKCKIKGKKLLSCVLQHEIDHLDGILFTEKAHKITQNE